MLYLDDKLQRAIEDGRSRGELHGARVPKGLLNRLPLLRRVGGEAVGAGLARERLVLWVLKTCRKRKWAVSEREGDI